MRRRDARVVAKPFRPLLAIVQRAAPMLAGLKLFIEPFVPRKVLRKWNAHAGIRRNYRQSPAELFGTIYRQKHWGGDDHDFYSGSGSYTPEVLEPFVTAVRAYLATFPMPPVVVDLGCGDFAVGSRLLDLAQHYCACDVVPELIARNRRLFASANLSFHVIDGVADPLPQGNIVIVKQVLQHLRNDQISSIVRKLSQYPKWIISEHLPLGEFVPNRDKLASGYARLHLNSGIVLTEEPFRIEPKATEVLCEALEGGGLIRTVAYRFDEAWGG
jgi:Methyltransferase domain